MLELEQLSAGYGQATALWDVSLQVNAGEIVTVVGPNGAGKTTLINAIAGLVRVRSGSLRFEGASIAALAPHRFCELGIALVPEGRRLFTGMTVRENLELGSYRKAARAARVRTLEQVFGMFPVLRQKEHDAAGTLSGGQQQALAIGRALMCQPRLLLLDEPSLGLAPSVVLDLFSKVREIHQAGVAVLLVEQNVSMALELASRAYVLEEGRVAAQGSPAELAGRDDIRKAYLGL